MPTPVRRSTPSIPNNVNTKTPANIQSLLNLRSKAQKGARIRIRPCPPSTRATRLHALALQAIATNSLEIPGAQPFCTHCSAHIAAGETSVWNAGTCQACKTSGTINMHNLEDDQAYADDIESSLCNKLKGRERERARGERKKQNFRVRCQGNAFCIPFDPWIWQPATFTTRSKVFHVTVTTLPVNFFRLPPSEGARLRVWSTYPPLFPTLTIERGRNYGIPISFR